jgi:hypothetical protein
MKNWLGRAQATNKELGPTKLRCQIWREREPLTAQIQMFWSGGNGGTSPQVV